MNSTGRSSTLRTSTRSPRSLATVDSSAPAQRLPGAGPPALPCLRSAAEPQRRDDQVRGGQRRGEAGSSYWCRGKTGGGGAAPGGRTATTGGQGPRRPTPRRGAIELLVPGEDGGQRSRPRLGALPHARRLGRRSDRGYESRGGKHLAAGSAAGGLQLGWKPPLLEHVFEQVKLTAILSAGSTPTHRRPAQPFPPP